MVKSNQGPSDTGTAPAKAERARILMATVDSLPEPYRILGLVEATVAVTTDVAPTAQLLDALEDEAVGLGADGVIGIRLSQITLPGTSRARFVGRVTDHVENTVVATALGTAVRRLPASQHGGVHPRQCCRSR